jgi:hypothetical protein
LSIDQHGLFVSKGGAMPRSSFHVVPMLIVIALVTAGRADDLDVPREKIVGEEPGEMVHRHLMRQIQDAVRQWKGEYEKLKTPEQVAAYQKRVRQKCLEAIGGLPRRTPLAPQVTGTVLRPGYRVEKIIFQSQPRHYVTALLFLPAAPAFRPPYPGVIVPCGHYLPSKGALEYQTMGALLALNGMAALVFDPIDQGERGQYIGPDGWPNLWGCKGHAMIGVGSILLGRSTARFEIWDGMCAIDYLQSRPEIDPRRIGCTGNSGGGTQTSYLMALDDRIRCAAPSCYLTSTLRLMQTIGPDDAEQNLFGQFVGGPHDADWIMMRAPSPVLMCAATKDFFDIGGTWDSFRYAKRLYTRLGLAEGVDLLENDAGHNYNASQREGVARWMSRWLLGRDRPITEPPITLLTRKEFRCTADGDVSTLPGARTVYDLNEDYENELAKKRAQSWDHGDRTARLAEVRRLSGIRKLAELPKPRVETLATQSQTGYRIEKLVITPEEGISLPALMFLPEKPQPGRVVLYVHQQGKAFDGAPGGPIERRVLAGETVLAVDVRGVGQTKSTSRGWNPPEVNDEYVAYMLGRCYLGMRAEDVLTCARYAAERLVGGREQAVRLVAVGKVGVSALHAAALEPSLFESVHLSQTLVSWSNVIHNRLSRAVEMNIAHGVLLCYDLPNLAASLGRKLTIEQPVDAQGRIISPQK